MGDQEDNVDNDNTTSSIMFREKYWLNDTIMCSIMDFLNVDSIFLFYCTNKIVEKRLFSVVKTIFVKDLTCRSEKLFLLSSKVEEIRRLDIKSKFTSISIIDSNNLDCGIASNFVRMKNLHHLSLCNVNFTSDILKCLSYCCHQLQYLELCPTYYGNQRMANSLEKLLISNPYLAMLKLRHLFEVVYGKYILITLARASSESLSKLCTLNILQPGIPSINSNDNDNHNSNVDGQEVQSWLGKIKKNLKSLQKMRFICTNANDFHVARDVVQDLATQIEYFSLKIPTSYTERDVVNDLNDNNDQNDNYRRIKETKGITFPENNKLKFLSINSRHLLNLHIPKGPQEAQGILFSKLKYLILAQTFAATDVIRITQNCPNLQLLFVSFIYGPLQGIEKIPEICKYLHLLVFLRSSSHFLDFPSARARKNVQCFSTSPEMLDLISELDSKSIRFHIDGLCSGTNFSAIPEVGKTIEEHALKELCCHFREDFDSEFISTWFDNNDNIEIH